MALDRRLERLEKKLQSIGEDFDSALLDETDAREESIATLREELERGFRADNPFWTGPMVSSFVADWVQESITEVYEAYETRIAACEERIESYVEHGVASIQLEAFEERIKGEMERRMDDLIEQRLAAFSQDIDKHVEEREKDSDSQGARQRRGRRGGRQGPLARKQQEREEAEEDA